LPRVKSRCGSAVGAVGEENRLSGSPIVLLLWRHDHNIENGRERPPKKVHLTVLIEQDEDGVFIVSVPTIAGCRSYGYTIDEAMKNITEAAGLCMEDSPPVSNGAFVGVRDLEINV